MEIEELSNREKQLKEWHLANRSDGFWYGIDGATDFLLEELTMRDRFQDEVKIVFKSYEEMVYVHFLIECLQKIIDKIGIKQPDSSYLISPLWDDVVEAAKHAYEVLMKDEDLDALLEAEEKRIVE
jgi:hypothetical protein